MIEPGPDDKIFSAAKLTLIIDALAAEGISEQDAVATLRLSREFLLAPGTRLSANESLEFLRNAARLSRDRHFAYHVGLRFHVSAYGMYGFAILSSTNFRQTMSFVMQYHQLATALADPVFKEADGHGIWTVAPLPYLSIDATAYRLIVEMQLGVHVTLLCDVMGHAFAAQEIRLTSSPPADAAEYPKIFGCAVRFDQAENQLLFDASLLDAAPKFGNEFTYKMVVEICDGMMEELKLRIGLVGKVREVILMNLMRPTSFEEVARHLNTSARTLRRKLLEEHTSFRKLVDELRMDMAIKYLRDTNLTVEDIAQSLGFSDAANFRHAFRRWTHAAPLQFRNIRS